MKHWLKRSFCLLLCLVMLCTLLPAFSARAEEIELIPFDEEEPADEEEIVLIEEPAEPMGTKPTITTQPKSKTAELDETVKFTVEASGAESYQWYYRKSSTAEWLETTLSGCTTATLKVAAKSTRDGWQFRCKVSNSSGYVYTDAATLTLKKETPTEKPVIVTQPASVSVKEEASAKFTVEATGAESYQWYYRKSSDASWAETSLSGCTTATLKVVAKSTRDGWQFRCKVSNSIGYVYTKSVTLTLLQKPTITTQPKDLTINEGGTAKFTVAASGATAYQWYWRTDSSSSWQKSTVSSATKATLTYTNLSASKSGRQYRCKVSNDAGYVYTKAATLTVTAKPVITAQPKDTTIYAGDTAKFTVTASGATAYQWYWRTDSSSSWQKSTVSSATKATLTYTNLSASKSGRQYRCKVSNDSGYVYTSVVTLTVLSLPKITKQPTDVTVAGGQKATFALTAENADSYQWYYRSDSSAEWKTCPYTGATAATMTTATITYIMDGYQFRCKVSNDYGYVFSATVTLTVTHNQPTITTQPTSTTVDHGDAVSFTVKASGGGLSYQWYWRNSSSSEWKESTADGAQTATMRYITTGYLMDGRQLRCKVSNDIGYVYTNTVTLSIRHVTPTITTQPTSQTVTQGDPVSLSVTATGGGLSYQWYWRDNSDDGWSESTASGAKTAKLTYAEAKLFMSGRQFRCKISNDVGTVYSNTVTLTVEKSKPKITTQPTSQTVSEGASATFTVEADYADSYQWYWKNGVDGTWKEVSGADENMMTFSSVPYSWNGYKFFCKVTNSVGSTSSYAVTLTVDPLPQITTHPRNAAIDAGDSVTFTVVADYVDSYQWYWRPDESTDWIGLPNHTASVSFSNVEASWNGRQFRCMLTNSVGSVYTEYATLAINSSVVRYRALLVGEVHFSTKDIATRNEKDVTMLENMLGSVKGPTGGSYTVTKKTDVSRTQLRTAILDAFAGADDNDVSLFFIATHGATGFATGEKAGRLTLITSYYHTETMTLAELADCLNNVPGKVIVLLGSCGSGAAIYQNGVDGADAGFDPEAFNEEAISAFAALDPVSNTGEFRSTKFYVLTAAMHQEKSWGQQGSDSFNFFTHYICQGVLNDKPADTDGNGTVGLDELYRYVYDNVLAICPIYKEGDPTPYYQHVQVYPENSSYALFK